MMHERMLIVKVDYQKTARDTLDGALSFLCVEEVLHMVRFPCDSILKFHRK